MMMQQMYECCGENGLTAETFANIVRSLMQRCKWLIVPDDLSYSVVTVVCITLLTFTIILCHKQQCRGIISRINTLLTAPRNTHVKTSRTLSQEKLNY